MMLIEESFQSIYQEMRQRNQNLLETTGVRIDSDLNQPVDNRKGVLLFSTYDNFFSQDLKSLQTEASKLFPNQVIYDLPALQQKKPTNPHIGQLHCSFFQIFPVSKESPRLAVDRVDDYIATTANALFTLPTFSILLKGVIAVPTGLLISGIPDQDVNKVREKLRADFTSENLPFTEPYKSDTTHSTLVRLANQSDPKDLIDFAERYKSVALGTLNVGKMYLAYGSWRMQDTEVDILCEFDLKNKTVTKKI